MGRIAGIKEMVNFQNLSLLKKKKHVLASHEEASDSRNTSGSE